MLSVDGQDLGLERLVDRIKLLGGDVIPVGQISLTNEGVNATVQFAINVVVRYPLDRYRHDHAPVESLFGLAGEHGEDLILVELRHKSFPQLFVWLLEFSSDILECGAFSLI